MSQLDVIKKIESELSANFTTYPVKYTNMKFIEPENNRWIKLTILFTGLESGTLGADHGVSGIMMRQGIFQVDGFSISAKGTNTMTEYLDSIRKHFEFESFMLDNDDCITFLSVPGGIRNIGDTPNGKYMQTLDLPFIWQENLQNS